jgi:hypothetical protein
MRALWIPCVLILASARVASAGGGGINLGWDDCTAHPATLDRMFACDTNAGTHTLVGSFVAPSCVNRMSANEIVMDLQSQSLAWPGWWGLRTGLCRSGSMNGNFDFTAGPYTCWDYWQAGAIGALAMDAPLGNRVRIKGVFALPAGDSRITSIPEGLEVYSYKCNINHAKTVGSDACPGCEIGICILLNSIKLNQPQDEPCGSRFLSAPAVRNFATWQGGPNAGLDCGHVYSPVKNATWGSVKALYR